MLKRPISRSPTITVFAVPGTISATLATGTNSFDTGRALRAPGRHALLTDYRAWLDSELKLLGNASHHAYSFGQANMAKRAIEQLDAELDKTLYVALDPGLARRALTALEMVAQEATALDPALDDLRTALRTALALRPQPEG